MTKRNTMMISVGLVFIALFTVSGPALAYNDDVKAPTAFVEGTRDYSIPYLEKTRKEVLSKYFTDAEMKHFDASLAELKNFNGRMLERSKTLQSQGGFLKENDSELAGYRTKLAYVTNLMFLALAEAEKRTNLPRR